LLVTGANGHLGRRICARLAGPGQRRVRAVVRSERAAQTLRELSDEARPDIRILDYGDAAALEAAAEGCRRAVHLVGIIKEGSQTRYVDAHEATCRTLATAGTAAGIEHVVYLSILGSRPDSANACLASKGRAEQILLESGVATSVLRVPMVLGAGDIASASLAGQARAAWLPLIGGGSTRHQPIDADDVISAILACFERPALADTALDLGGPENLSHRELVERAAATLGKPAPRFLPLPLGLMRSIVALVERVSADPPMTTAMLGVLQHDDVVDAKEACERLGLSLAPLDDTLRRCLLAPPS
jgi:NADH dehydrogenase